MTLKELIVLLKTASDVSKIDKRKEEIGELMPEIKMMFGFDQKHQAHQYDLWIHSLHVAMNLPRGLSDDMLYLAALLHDIGKPETQCKGKKTGDTNMHYYGHPQKSREIIEKRIIPDLARRGYNLSCTDIQRLLYYVAYHDDDVALKWEYIHRHLKLVSFEEFQHLMLLQVADAKAHVLLPRIEERIRVCSMLVGEEGKQLWQNHLRSENERK